MTEHGKVKRRRFHPAYVLAASVIAIVVFFGSLALFPEWSQSAALILALAVGGIFGAVTFLADFRTAFAPEADPPAPPPSVVTSHTTISGDHVGGDKVDGNKITAGRDVVINQVTAPLVNALHQLPPPLALVIADRLKAQYPDAQFFLSLRGASDAPVKPVEAMQSVIRAYHPTAQLPDDATQIAALYRSVLDGQRAIVLLDDAKDATQVLPLLPPASCILLITTRNTFAVPGLHARKLETLSPADAHDLLIAIAPSLAGVILSRTAAKDLFANQPEILRAFGAQNDTIQIADVIALFCGYLPLALRAAASLIAATPDLNPLTYATQLRDERTRLTKIGKEGVDIDVEASLNLSYRQLSPQTAQVFGELAVFPDSFYAISEENVCKDAGHVHLSQLVKLSLVQFDENRNRYRLHDLIRLFARTKVIDEDLTVTQQRHAKYYGGISLYAQRLYYQGNNQALIALDVFDREWPNISQGQNWATAHGKEGADIARLCGLYANNELLSLRLDLRDQVRWIESALAVSDIVDDPHQKASLLGNLGSAYAELGNRHYSMQLTEEALSISVKILDKAGECIWLNNLGNRHRETGNRPEALRYHKLALSIAREIKDRRSEALVLGSIGNTLSDAGQTSDAIKYYVEALPLTREIGDLRSEGRILNSLGVAYLNIRDTKNSIESCERALRIATTLGDRFTQGQALSNLGARIFTREKLIRQLIPTIDA